MLCRVLPFLPMMMAWLLAACSGDPPEPAAGGFLRAAVVGTLQSPAIVEASGLAYSRRDPALLWAINDGGEEPALHAIGRDGTALGSVLVEGARNVDWEDLASFRYGDAPWLLIADTGDNGGIRDYLTLYVVPEPEDVNDPSVAPAWTIRFAYPDGPHDTEAVAVDAAAEQVYVLTKRTVPPELHVLPLHPPEEAGVLTTRKVLGVATLPARDETPVNAFAGAVPYHWQPTGMDFAADGSGIAILTYADVYYYARQASETPAEVLSREPYALSMPLMPIAEAVAFDDTDGSLYVTTEGRHAPLLRFDHD